MESLNTRQELLLKALIESFISDGQPVGSSKLSKASDIGISSATIRNVFVDLEDLGYIYSPHKSAGRVPTGSAALSKNVRCCARKWRQDEQHK